MLSVVCWRWTAPGGPSFGPEYPNRLRAALERHLHLEHELVLVTDDAVGIDPRIRIVPIPTTFAHTPRCRRRMQVFSGEFAVAYLGPRILSIDLDVVIVDDLTPIVDRQEPLVMWKVGYAGVFSGSFHLMDAGILDDLWRRFAENPEGYPVKVSKERVPSDQAMLNAYLTDKPVPFWTEADGFVTYFGKGYERQERHGVGPRLTQLPPGARIVVMGSADKAQLDEGRDPWMREHWTSLGDETSPPVGSRSQEGGLCNPIPSERPGEPGAGNVRAPGVSEDAAQ